jgi:hypothetical protein
MPKIIDLNVKYLVFMGCKDKRTPLLIRKKRQSVKERTAKPPSCQRPPGA